MSIQIEEMQLKAFDAIDNRLNLNTSLLDRSLLLQHLLLLIEKNKTMNLTRIDTEESGLLLHIEDSLTGYKEFERFCKDEFCDMGSGGGYPGIPLAILANKKALLVDSVKKKAKAVESIVEELGLKQQILVAGIRLEELVQEKAGEYSFLTARALSSLPSLLELATPLLQKDGYFLAYKGIRNKEEEARAKKACKLFGLELFSLRETSIGEEKIARTLYLYKKTGQSKIILPRKNGLAQKKPLS